MKKHKQNNIYEVKQAVEKNAGKIKRAAKGINAYDKASENLSQLNTMRGGEKGFKGFVAENMEAAESTAHGRNTTVLNDNGIADLKHSKINGIDDFKQMKIGYKPGQIDFSKYKGQTVVIDNGNPYFKQLKAEAAKSGVKVVEGHVSAQEAKFVSDMMQFETKITGSKTSVLVPKAYQGAKTVGLAHSAGVAAAKSGAAAGAGFSLGSNIVKVAKGKKSVGEAAEEVVADTVTASAVSYGVGATGSLIASTTTGAAAIEAAGSVGTAIAAAPGVGSIISAGTAATAAIGGIGTTAAGAAAGALSGAAGSIAAGASSIAAGTAAASAVSAVGAGVVATSAAVGAACVAAAPVVVVGAVLGGLWSFFSD